MKRTFVCLCTLVLLVSCSRPGTLPPADVLQKASQAAQSLASAHFALQASVHGQTDFLGGVTDGTVNAEGDMQDGGNQLSLSVKAHVEQALANTTFDVDGDVLVAGQHQTYIKLRSLSISPTSDILPPALVTQMLNQWWKLPSGASGSALGTQVAPDPELLKMQTQVVSVSADHGLTNLDGSTVYFYDVTIDHAKLATYLSEIAKREGMPEPQIDKLSLYTAKGQIWIDADTFFIRKISWSIESTDPKKPAQISITAQITKQNEPVNIVPPQDSQPFQISLPSLVH